MRTPSARTVARLLRFGVTGVLVVGVATRNVSVVVNATPGLAVTFLSALLRRDYRLHLSPAVSPWVALAVFPHAVGMAGPYHAVWWDHLPTPPPRPSWRCSARATCGGTSPRSGVAGTSVRAVTPGERARRQ